ncbi:hypothetical protein ANCDUO_19544, partial [Ancylostoma duodenale]
IPIVSFSVELTTTILDSETNTHNASGARMRTSCNLLPPPTPPSTNQSGLNPLSKGERKML